MLTGCAIIGTVSLVTVLIAYPQGTPMSADPGAPAIPIWVILLPSLVGIALTLLLPWRPGSLPVRPARGDRLHVSTAVLVLLAVVFPAAVVVYGLRNEDYVLAKAALLILIPAVVVAVLRPAVRIQVPREWWRWWAPAVVVIVWTLLSQVAPWNPRPDFSGIDPEVVIVGALATALTAGVGEELFYRRWLQTRLEAVLSPWAGIALTSLLFGLMHLGSHSTGEPLLDIARVVVAQGSFGLFLGVMWWRYRNLTMIIVAHIIVNGWHVVAGPVRQAVIGY